MKRPIPYAILAFAILLTVAFPTTGTAVATETAGAETVGPQAVVVETLFDAGRVAKGEEIVHDFVIRNEGDAPLHITDVRPACGCTVADYDETIPPGESGKVHAVLDTSTENGGISKGITVLTDDPETPRVVLTIRAVVEPLVYVRPGYARFIQPKHSEPGVVEQIVFTDNFEGLQILGIESPYPFLEVTTRPATEEERQEKGVGKQWVIRLTLDYEAAPIGALADYVTAKVNHPQQKSVKIPVSGFVRPMVVPTPDEAVFSEVEVTEDEPAFGVIILKNYAVQDLDISVKGVDVPGVDLDIEEVRPGREFRLRVTLTAGAPKGAFAGTIRLETDHPKKPTIEIPISGTRL